MKLVLITVTCFFIPLWAGSVHRRDTTEVKDTNIVEEEPVEVPITNLRKTDIDVNDYRGPLQNLKSNIPKNAILKKEFNGNSYEILTSTHKGSLDYATLEYVEAVEACKKSQPEPRTLLTFKSAKENSFVANWLFNELKIVTQVWIGLIRVNGTNDFVWPDGTKLTTTNEQKLLKNWHKCEPNDITTTDWAVDDWGENCVEMYSSYYPYPLRCDVAARAGQWNDIPCRQIYNMVVCQKTDPTHKHEASEEVIEKEILSQEPVEEPITDTPVTDIDVNIYRGPLQNLKSDIPENATLQKVFNGISYEILTSTNEGPRNFATLEYIEAVEACKKSQSEPRTLLTFKSATENEFIASWLFDELKIVTQVWIGLTRINATNDFIWPDGTKLTKTNEEKLFKNWDKCEPNDITTTSWGVEDWGENCVEMYSSYYPYPLRCDEIAKAGQWNDIPCKQIYNMVVCQGNTA